ncbi:hypothetical protein BO71DRAFT_466894 [Aspergillus ellipticus CBS 707.79]|uniref:Uncharacterized protein n=1 Tax=Aspergillus ellipticus CBS 707.79 TaxID=1448320 RepID=A0A319DIX7_9EURO|nr:hypothetical protein BO71DRAFT_466894 [Aspergillus ellipticus CBS 707.79]
MATVALNWVTRTLKKIAQEVPAEGVLSNPAVVKLTTQAAQLQKAIFQIKSPFASQRTSDQGFSLVHPEAHSLCQRNHQPPFHCYQPTTYLHGATNPTLPPPFSTITDSITNAALKPGTKWGFSIYRCDYQDDPTWQRMLQLIHHDIAGSLELNRRLDLLLHHELIIHNDRTQSNGATSHQVRDHFRTWAAEEMTRRLVTPNPGDLDLMLKGSRDDPGPEWFHSARYNFCLMVDALCLESLDRMHFPVVKFVWKQWGNLDAEERNQPVHEVWEDGVTDQEEEDVGWMYMSVLECVD